MTTRPFLQRLFHKDARRFFWRILFRSKEILSHSSKILSNSRFCFHESPPAKDVEGFFQKTTSKRREAKRFFRTLKDSFKILQVSYRIYQELLILLFAADFSNQMLRDAIDAQGFFWRISFKSEKSQEILLLRSQMNPPPAAKDARGFFQRISHKAKRQAKRFFSSFFKLLSESTSSFFGAHFSNQMLRDAEDAQRFFRVLYSFPNGALNGCIFETTPLPPPSPLV